MNSMDATAGDGHVQMQVEGNSYGSVTVGNGVAVTGVVNGGVTIRSGPDREGQVHRFDIARKVRIPVFAEAVGAISGVISIIGFVLGASSLGESLKAVLSVRGWVDPAHSVRIFIGTLFIVLSVYILVLGVRCCSFLRKNILHLPKRWYLPACAGIRNERGRTFPYLLKLSLKCPKCANRNLRFKRVQDGNLWIPMAVCTRHGSHSLPVDISDNDFDRSLPR